LETVGLQLSQRAERLDDAARRIADELRSFDRYPQGFFFIYESSINDNLDATHTLIHRLNVPQDTWIMDLVKVWIYGEKYRANVQGLASGGGTIVTSEAAIPPAVTSGDPSPLTTIFSDDFSGDLSKWTVDWGTWVIEAGELSQNDTGAIHHHLLAGSVSWDNYTVKAKLMKKDAANQYATLGFRRQDLNNLYEVQLDPNNMLRLAKKIGENYYSLAEVPFETTIDVWYNVEVEAVGNRIKIKVDNELKIDYTDSSPILAGRIFLCSISGHTHFDDVTVGMAVTGNTTPSQTTSGAPSIANTSVSGHRHAVNITCMWIASADECWLVTGYYIMGVPTGTAHKNFNGPSGAQGGQFLTTSTNAHTHPMPHTHNISFSSHTHGMDHTHQVPGSTHSHQVDIPNHTHVLNFGIYEALSATANISLKIVDPDNQETNLGVIGTGEFAKEAWDLTQYFTKKGNYQLVFSADGAARVRSMVFMQPFILPEGEE